MKYQTVPIGKLKPDPNQPRKHIDEEALKALAVSIKNEGIINPIEVDESFGIITGEQRWRAAKIAGLKEVPVKVIGKLSAKGQFIHQMQENIHQNTMAPLDMAEALERIRKTVVNPAVGVKQGRGGFRHGTRGIKELHDLLGIPEQTISDYLFLLSETGEMKKALQTPGFQTSKVREITKAPEKYQEKLRHVVATQKSIPRDTVGQMALALRRADRYGETDKADKLLNENFEGLGTIQTLNKINKIVPDEESRTKGPADALRSVSEKFIEIMELLDERPLYGFDDFHRPLLVGDINRFGAYLGEYLKGRNTETLKVTEAKTI